MTGRKAERKPVCRYCNTENPTLHKWESWEPCIKCGKVVTRNDVPDVKDGATGGRIFNPTQADAVREAQAALDERNERESAVRKAQADAEWKARKEEGYTVAAGTLARDPLPAHECRPNHRTQTEADTCPDAPLPVAEFKGHMLAACGCEVVGKDSAGNPLPACGVQGFRYYGGVCKADVRPAGGKHEA